jgi:hypothetical protein
MAKKINLEFGDQQFHCFVIDINSIAINTLVSEEFKHMMWRA